MDADKLTTKLHYELIHGILEHGACPTNSDLAELLDVEESEIAIVLRDLSDIHGVVLHPHAVTPWVIHPFSITPTINWIENKRASWWAPCVWCAMGVAALVGGDVKIHTRYGAELDPLIIDLKDGHPQGLVDVLVHFAIPHRELGTTYMHTVPWCFHFALQMKSMHGLNGIAFHLASPFLCTK